MDGAAWFSTGTTLVWTAVSGIKTASLTGAAWAMARLALTSGTAATIDIWIAAA